MLSVILMSGTYQPFMLGVIYARCHIIALLLGVIILNVIMLSVVMLSVWHPRSYNRPSHIPP